MFDVTTFCLLWLLLALCVIWYDHRQGRNRESDALRSASRERKTKEFMIDQYCVSASKLLKTQKALTQERENRRFLEQLMDMPEETAAAVELERKPGGVVVAWARRPT